MSAVIRTPLLRVALAIALSALIHAAVLWLPQLQFSHAAAELPPLTASLERLPESVTRSAENAKPAKPATGTMQAMDKTEEPAAPRPFPQHLQLTFAVYHREGKFKTGEVRQQLDIGMDRYTP